jgi:hypothetical protein
MKTSPSSLFRKNGPHFIFDTLHTKKLTLTNREYFLAVCVSSQHYIFYCFDYNYIHSTGTMLDSYKTNFPLALQWALRGHIWLHRHSQATEFGDGSYPWHLRTSRHWYYEVGGVRAILGGVLVASARMQLCNFLDTNVQWFQLLSDDALGHTPAQVLNQEPHTTVLRECEGVETHTFPPSRDRSALTAALNSSAVDGTTINVSPFSWAAKAGGPQPGQESMGVANTCNKKGRFVGLLAYGGGTACCHLGVCSGAVRHATQRSGHVFKGHAPNDCLRRGSGFSRSWTVVCGIVRPTWLFLQAGGPSYHCSVRQPALGRAELPAALGS